MSDTARIEALKRKLAARQGKAEFKQNCEELKAEIARLESGVGTAIKDI